MADPLSSAQRRGSRLNYLWRLLMTAVSFTLFGLGGLLLSLLGFNLLLLVQRNSLRRRLLARRAIAFSFRCFLRFCRMTGVFDYRIEGADALQRDRGCLIIANHPSLIDYVMIASVLPEMDCLVKADLQKNPFVRGVIRAADYLINSEAETLLPDSQRRLARGDTILIFPEGTRTRYGQPLTLQRGAANIAVRAGCDLRVVHITCSQRMLDKQSRWFEIPPVKPRFTVRVRHRIDSQSFFESNPDAQPLAARRLTRHLQQALVPENR
ncbi:acyl-phosphate glycerol 3-phosphate acyltransferase [Pantoea deleyi]|uniref:1-acyl-sn-glycerol-3-phosphate acyltransferase n=1 Tax=Pantoea deleyi TaxID=470932 RepID=A0A506Q4C5_9GAMM|nr:lysophospholipid acyltransferase family protein [Pantoea deleyi]ORM75561.1 acyl-phosphate glycerol 3-phosphate acyltransferase [Pantoea deleyi]TPV40791.1 1-acyl-sn-glycerol-3-phosphate acyltransferase [Pantoea deleyi]